MRTLVHTLRNGVSMDVETESVAIRAWASGRLVFVELTAGRQIGFRADRFRILSEATDEQLKAVQ